LMEWQKLALLVMKYWHIFKLPEVIDLIGTFVDNPARFGHAPRVFSVARLLFCEEY